MSKSFKQLPFALLCLGYSTISYAQSNDYN
jgi:hypothetical protein